MVVAACSGTACPSNGLTRDWLFDTLGRETQQDIYYGTSDYYSKTTYNAASGKIGTVRAFGGFVTQRSYNATGYLSEIKDNSSGFVYWTANAMDAELHLTEATAGNGVITYNQFSPETGLIESICATPDSGTCDGATENYSFGWDTIGRLTQRQDTFESVTENFCYDSLNRLTNYAVGGASCTQGTLVKSVGYDSGGVGNIASKSDVGTYSYPQPGQPLPHAVSSITGTLNGATNPTFS